MILKKNLTLNYLRFLRLFNRSQLSRDGNNKKAQFFRLNLLAELQQTQGKINNELSQINGATNSENKSISFESLSVFRKALVDLISKRENDLKVRSSITKLIVHKIEILQDGFEIHFHVGEAHYNTALEGQTSNASFFVSFTISTSFKNKKPDEGLPSSGFKFDYRNEQVSKSQLSELIYRDSSSCLTNGGAEPKWLMAWIQEIRRAPHSFHSKVSLWSEFRKLLKMLGNLQRSQIDSL